MASRGAVLRGAKSIPGGARPTAAPQGAGNGLFNSGRGLNAPSIGAVSPLAAQLANESGYANTYGPFLPRPTRTFTEGAFGPFSPILPVPVDTPEEGLERPGPRRYEYQVGWNLPVGQPGSEGLKLANFESLRRFADVYSIARACIEYRKNQVRGIEWDIIPTPDATKDYQGSPSKMADFGKRRAKAKKFFNRPDPNFSSYALWLSALLEEVLVFDALSLFVRPVRGRGQGKGVLGSDLDSLVLLNGPTIRPLVDLAGGVPRPPAPAYQQFLYGVPRSDHLTIITERDLDDSGLREAKLGEFRGDQMLYVPMVPRAWTPYGFPPVERALIPIMTGLQKQAYQYDVFSESTVPAAYVIPGDTAMTPNQLRELQDALNAIAGDPAWKQKIIVLPPGSHIEPQKQISGADELDQWLAHEVTMAFGMTPMEIGITPGRSSSSSGGAQNQMAKMTQDRGEDTGLTPVLKFLSDIFNVVLRDVCGQSDMLFTFEGLQQEEDQDALTGVLVQQFQNGFRTLDEVRQELNLQPYGLQESTEPLIATPNGPVPLSTAVENAQAGAQQAQATAQQAQLAADPEHAKARLQASLASSQAQVDSTRARTESTAAQTESTRARTQMAQESHSVSMNEPSPAQQAAASQVPPSKPARAAAAATNRETASAAKSAPDPVLVKRAAAEFAALSRHLLKGRPVSTWDARFIPQSALSDVARAMADGVDPSLAVKVAEARASKSLALPATEYEWVEKAGGSSSSSSGTGTTAQSPPPATPITQAASLAAGAMADTAALSTWPAWALDAKLASMYASQLRVSFSRAMSAVTEFLRQLFSGRVRVTPTLASQEVSGIIARYLQPVISDLHAEGHALGYRSAMALVPGRDGSVESPDWGGWEPGQPGKARELHPSELPGLDAAGLINSISETGLGDLASQLAHSLDQGQSAEEFSRSIEDSLRIEPRADLIAQTEVTRAVSRGARACYLDSGVDQREWLVAPDEKVCVICRGNEADGPVPLSQAFSSGDLDSPAHPRCRCATVPAVTHGFDITDMKSTPLSGYNPVPAKQPAMAAKAAQSAQNGASSGIIDVMKKKNGATKTPPQKRHAQTRYAHKQHSGEKHFTCDQGHRHWGANGAAGILFRAPRPDGTVVYLLQKRRDGADHPSTWGTFGGALLDGENPRDGAEREAKEELGTVPYKLHGFYNDDHGGWAYTTYLATSREAFWPPFDGETPDESAGWGWFTPEEMEELPLLPALRDALPAMLATMDHLTVKVRRAVGLTGQETWEDRQEPQPPAAGGGAWTSPPGAVPGFTAGAEPPRWDGSEVNPRVMTAPEDEDDAAMPDGRVASPRPQVPFPSEYMDSYWPAGQVQPQAPESSPGAATSVPPRGMGISKRFNPNEPRDEHGRWTDGVAGSVIHGWAMILDGKEPGTAQKNDFIMHGDHGMGVISSVDDDGSLHASFSDGTEGVLGDAGDKAAVSAAMAEKNKADQEARRKAAGFHSLHEPFTTDEQMSVDGYLTEAGNRIYNDPLRNGENASRHHGELDSAIAKSTAQADGAVYRGLALPEETDLSPGTEFTDLAYMSTTTSRDVANTFAEYRATGKDISGGTISEMKVFGGKPVVMRIPIKKGDNVLKGDPSVSEYVLPRGQRYRVKSVDDDGTVNLERVK